MNQETVVYQFAGISFSNKKEPSAELENIKLRERRRLERKHAVWFSLHEIGQKGQTLETESRAVASRD